jgi:chaperonin GroEL
LIIASVEAQPLATLIANKAKGNIKVNIIDPPGFGPTRRDTMEDVAFLTGAKLMSEELGDDLDLISPDVLGYVKKAVTDDKSTVLQIADLGNELKERIDNVNAAIKNEDNPFIKRKLEQRLAMLNGKVAVIKVGGNSKVELKEKKDRVEDAIYAVKAALKEGIIPGGGIALLNASEKIKTKAIGEELLMKSIKAPYHTILENAGLHTDFKFKRKGQGVNVVNGRVMNMVKAGIIDPVLVTKTALKNAVSVVLTIISADCVINNTRVENASN